MKGLEIRFYLVEATRISSTKLSRHDMDVELQISSSIPEPCSLAVKPSKDPADRESVEMLPSLSTIPEADKARNTGPWTPRGNQKVLL